MTISNDELLHYYSQLRNTTEAERLAYLQQFMSMRQAEAYLPRPKFPPPPSPLSPKAVIDIASPNPYRTESR